MTKLIKIYTDGSCLGNPGPGGWAAMIMYNNEKVCISGNEKDTTNNRMEMTAIYKPLEYVNSNLSSLIKEGAKVQINSDSNLIIQTLNQGWKRKANTDIWALIDQQRGWLSIEWNWVKAHANDALNNEVDRLAQSEARKV